MDEMRKYAPAAPQPSFPARRPQGPSADLELMLMRMPDRLTFTVEIDPGLRTLAFPQMGLLKLVENAVRHGIDRGVDARVDAKRGRALQGWQ